MAQLTRRKLINPMRFRRIQPGLYRSYGGGEIRIERLDRIDAHSLYGRAALTWVVFENEIPVFTANSYDLAKQAASAIWA